MTKRAAAWVTTDAAVAARGSRRSTTRPRQRRPITAMVVVTATANAASERPIVGSRIAIWCTMKPTCAVKASANGAEIDQKAKLRNSSQRDRSAEFAFTSEVDGFGARDSDHCFAGTGTWIKQTTVGSRKATMATVAVNMAEVKPIAPTRSTSTGAITMPP